MDLTAYYPVFIVLGVILLFIVVPIGAFLIGKQKYNALHGIVKEKKVKEKKAGKEKSDSDIKLSEKDAAAVAAFNKNRDKETGDSDAYDKEVNTLKEEASRDKKVIKGPIIVVNENGATNEPADEPTNEAVKDEEVVEWKPPAEEKKCVAETEAASAAAIPEKPEGDEWNDEDLELFEARTYAFDEETQSGYMKDKEEQKTAASEETDMPFIYRERREQMRDPADDEGVQVFETLEKDQPAVEPVKTDSDESKKNNSKYAYFDSVMEKE